MKTLAAILVELNAPLALEEIEIPALQLGQVLVEVFYSGICGSQIGEIQGVKGPDLYLPHLLGHEGTGRVLEVGAGVRRVKVGDTVVLHWRKALGLESVPAFYQSPRGKINAGWVTTFSRHTVVSENRLTPIDPTFDPRMATLFGCAVTTAMGVIHNNARLRIGESVAILGAGGVGLSIVQAASLAGGNPIIAVDLIDARLALAKSLGATHTINAKTENVEARIMQIAGPRGVDAAIENTGNVNLIELAYRVTSPKGKCVLVGVPRKDQNASIHTLPLHFGKTITGSHGGESQPDIDIPNYVRLIHAGRLNLQPLIGPDYPLTEINRAIEDQSQGRSAGRIMIRMKQ